MEGHPAGCQLVEGLAVEQEIPLNRVHLSTCVAREKDHARIPLEQPRVPDQIAHVLRGHLLEGEGKGSRPGDPDVTHARERSGAIGSRAVGSLRGMLRRSGAEQVGQGFSEQAGPDDLDALPTLAVRRDGLVGVISRYRLVDDRDPFPADPFPAAEASFPREDGGVELVRLRGVAEGFVGEPLGQRVVDQKRHRPAGSESRRLRQGPRPLRGRPRAKLQPAQDRLVPQGVVMRRGDRGAASESASAPLGGQALGGDEACDHPGDVRTVAPRDPPFLPLEGEGGPRRQARLHSLRLLVELKSLFLDLGDRNRIDRDASDLADPSPQGRGREESEVRGGPHRAGRAGGPRGPREHRGG